MKLAIFGFGGHAREVAVQIGKPVDFYVDDEFVTEYTNPISTFNPQTHAIMIAVADPLERKKIVEKLPITTKYFTYIHPTCLIFGNDVVIEEGSFVGANSILTTNIKIGKHAILNRGNQIGHDSIIGDYFSAMPGAVVSGNVTIGDRCYLGTNSTIIEKKSLFHDITIGANGVVIENLNEPGVYVGVPVKKVNK